MRAWVVISIGWLVAGCGDEAPGPRGPKRNLQVVADEGGPAPEGADDREGDGDGPDAAPESTTRRTAAVGGGRVTCPGGTEHQGAPPPHGRESFCVRRTVDGAVRHGPYRQWNEDGTVAADGTFTDGERDGQWTEYNADGTPKALTTFAEGTRDGPWKTWHPDGTPSGTGSYRDGRKDGTATFWYPDGTKKAEGTWKDDVKVGRSTNWAEDGSLQSRGDYVAGNKHGPWLEAEDGGDPVQVDYDNGTRR